MSVIRIVQLQIPSTRVDLLLFGTGLIAPTAFAVKALVAGAAAAMFYARFRLPFALLPVAGSLVVAIVAMTWEIGGASMQSLVLLACGLGVFAAAKGFDVSDRERTTRRADCAFWLHLLAAPLIVHSLISMVAPDANPRTMTSPVALIIVAIVAVLGLVAVAIDRRALLVSTLSYLGFVIAHVINTTAGAAAATEWNAVFFSTLAILGIMVLALGVGWLPLRRRLTTILPISLINHLPPAIAAA